MIVKSLGYVIIETEKRAEWDAFMTDVVGAMKAPTDEAGVSLYRVDERPFRFRVVDSNRDWLSAAGLEVSNRADLETLAARVEAAGRPVKWGTPEETAIRQVEAFFATSDPSDNGLEFFCGSETADTPFVSPQGIPNFVTGELGMGHAVFNAPDFAATHAFYNDVIGLGNTDFPEMKLFGPDGPSMHFAFMHAATGRHHAIAIAEGPKSPSGGVHIMLELPNMLEVGRAHDRMLAAGCKESATIGQHVNDETTGFYVQTPSGFDLEIGHGSIVVDPKTWETTAHETISYWGQHWAWQKELAEAQKQGK